jgi:hypothetical protein
VDEHLVAVKTETKMESISNMDALPGEPEAAGCATDGRLPAAVVAEPLGPKTAGGATDGRVLAAAAAEPLGPQTAGGAIDGRVLAAAAATPRDHETASDASDEWAPAAAAAQPGEPETDHSRGEMVGLPRSIMTAAKSMAKPAESGKIAKENESDEIKPLCSTGIADKRMRRIMAVQVHSGKRRVSEEVFNQWNNKGAGRDKINRIFATCSMNPDRVLKQGMLSVAESCAT